MALFKVLSQHLPGGTEQNQLQLLTLIWTVAGRWLVDLGNLCLWNGSRRETFWWRRWYLPGT